MIYLIGGPPKCGKTTLAKELSRSKNIPWVSTDTLQNVIKPYLNKQDLLRCFPTTSQRERNNDEKYSRYSVDEIISAYRQQAKTIYPAIDMFAISEITDGNDFIIEGYHIEPKIVAEMCLKYPDTIKGIFLVKSDEDQFVIDIKKSTTPNDWIITRTDNEETYKKIARVICKYGSGIRADSEEFGCKVMNMDIDFHGQITAAVSYLVGK